MLRAWNFRCVASAMGGVTGVPSCARVVAATGTALPGKGASMLARNAWLAEGRTWTLILVDPLPALLARLGRPNHGERRTYAQDDELRGRCGGSDP